MSLVLVRLMDQRGSNGFAARSVVRGGQRPPHCPRPRLWALGALALVLAGCTSLPQWAHNRFRVGPNYCRPPAPTAPDWIDAADPQVQSDPAQDCAWWTLLNDPQLNGLIDAAYRQNLDLRAAGTRVLEARALRGIAVGNLFPQTQTANMASLHSQISQNLQLALPEILDINAVGFNASWELDLWGRYRRAIEAADANLEASVEGYGEVLVLLLSEVATRYVELRTFEQRLEYARNNVAIQKGSLELAEARLQQGAASELDVRQARTNLSQTEATIPVLEAGARQASNALCVLLGMPPVDLEAALQPAPIPSVPAQISMGFPADLLRRRPDVRRAEREVAAQSARIGIAEAELYPSLSLNGYLGYTATSVTELIEPQSFTAFILPQFRWNVLNYGRIANNIAVQDARLQGAALRYQQSVLRAGQETEDALVRFLQAQRQTVFLERAVEDAGRSVELVQRQWEAGATDFNRVYVLQSALVTQQDQLAIARGSIAFNLVAVYRALGGGWVCFLNGQVKPAALPMQPAPTFAPPEEVAAPPAQQAARPPAQPGLRQVHRPTLR